METWQGFRRGVDLGGWFSQCDHTEERYDNFIGEKDFARIASWGLDHVRLPVDYDLVETEDGQYKEKGFGRIAQAFGWCRDNGLNMVLDLHKTYGFSFDKGENESGFFDDPSFQERFYALWEQFARRFGDGGGHLAFELLNEVTDKAYAEKWNRIADTCIRRIRAIAPTVPILVGGYWNNSIEALADLAAPQDENIIYNFHCYDPVLFTHQGAYWVDGMDTSFRISLDRPVKELAARTEEILGRRFVDFEGLDPEKPLDEKYFIRRFEKAVRVAEQRHVRLYCGEYGVIDRAAPEDALRWYRLIHAAFERFGIARAAWSYREMDFGLSDDRMAPVIGELVKLL